MDVRDYNREAWDKQVEQGNPWTQPVSPEVIARARRGDWNVLLTEQKFVPREWFGDIRGRDILGLASGGGQQAPTFAAAGANVTVLDNVYGDAGAQAIIGGLFFSNSTFDCGASLRGH